MYDKLGLFIGGEWHGRGGAGALDVAGPAPGEVIGSVPSASVRNVEQASAAKPAADSGY